MLKPITLQTKQISKLSSSWWERKTPSQPAWSQRWSQPTDDNWCQQQGRWTEVLTRAAARGAAMVWGAFMVLTLLKTASGSRSYSHGWHPQPPANSARKNRGRGSGVQGVKGKVWCQRLAPAAEWKWHWKQASQTKDERSQEILSTIKRLCKRICLLWEAA